MLKCANCQSGYPIIGGLCLGCLGKQLDKATEALHARLECIEDRLVTVEFRLDGCTCGPEWRQRVTSRGERVHAYGCPCVEPVARRQWPATSSTLAVDWLRRRSSR